MGKPDIPAFLYHYTTVDSLALILKNKNIQFRPLTMMDDLQEEKIDDEYKLARFVFVSSWTEEEKESIPMWKMYSDWENGVRIKLPTYPFQEYELTKEVFEEITGHTSSDFGNKALHFIRPFSEIYHGEYRLRSEKLDQLLYKVKYTKNDRELFPKIRNTEHVDESAEDVYLKFSVIGQYKHEAWEFQKEWRYKFTCLPTNFQNDLENTLRENNELLENKIFNNKYHLPINQFFLSICDKAFSQMEITCSPKLTESNRLFIDLLKEKYNPTLTVRESALKDSIR